MSTSHEGELSTNKDPVLTASVEMLIASHGGKPVARNIPKNRDNRIWFVIERPEDGRLTRLACR